MTEIKGGRLGSGYRCEIVSNCGSVNYKGEVIRAAYCCNLQRKIVVTLLFSPVISSFPDNMFYHE